MEEQEQAKSPVQILTITRDVFKASHWIHGAFTQEMWVEETLYYEGGSTNYKPVGCSVGGLRYAALAPMDNALDEAWMVANFQELGEASFQNREMSLGALNSYMEAITALAREISGDEHVDEYLDEADDDDSNVYSRMQWIEDVIVSWNDDYDYTHIEDMDEREERRKEIVEREILPMFNRAIERLSREGVPA